MKSKNISITLPASRSTVSLPPALAEGLKIFIAHQGEWLSVIQLREAGIISVPYVVDELRKIGAVVDQERRPTTTTAGRPTHTQHYRFRGVV